MLRLSKLLKGKGFGHIPLTLTLSPEGRGKGFAVALVIIAGIRPFAQGERKYLPLWGHPDIPCGEIMIFRVGRTRWWEEESV